MQSFFQRGLSQRSFFPHAAAALTLALLFTLPAIAAERVTLRSGFDLVCDHQTTIPGGVRLFLTPADDSYLDVSPGDIVIEQPDKVEPAKTASSISPLDAKKTDIPTILAQAGATHHIDADLLASVIRAESNGNPRAVSRAGAQGLMQLMPGTAATLGVHDSFAPDQNIAGGTAYLDWLLTRYQDNPVLALAAYNAGPEAVDRYHGVPPYAETRLYVARVLHDFNQRTRQLAHNQTQARTHSLPHDSTPATPSF